MKTRGQPNNDRQIRVFISSTFRDMQAERDYLVKLIFPQLRKLCESRGVIWGEVDLRWGVTDEQAAEGKVLPICLEEIKRCRPYFIGLLSERYGWVPDAIPADVIERELWLKEHLHGEKSVTELEILHGVLREEKMHGHAFFYFRDPAFINTVPPDKRLDFVTEDAASAEKLRVLKEAIRHAQVEQICTLRENYPTPEALGELVLTDLTKVINDTWPEGSQPDPLDREAMDHEAYAKSREHVYVGRQEYFDRIDAHGAANDTQPLVILGESGSGKSALLANWVARYRQAHPDALVLQHYIGATPYSADWAAMLRRLMGEFKRRLGIQHDIPDQPDALRSAFPNWLYMAAAKGRVVLVLDALNQLEDRDGAPDLVWLPPVLPENVRLIVSTLPGRSLDEIQKRNWPTLKVELLSPGERRKLIAEYLAQHAKSLNVTRVERIANAPQSANPLYLRVLLDELRLVRTHEELEERIGDYLKAETPNALYEKVIARWEQDYGGDSDLVGDTLSLLWSARRGLTETELLQALGKNGEPLPRSKWSPLFLAISDALVNRGGLLNFAHAFLRTAVQNSYLSTDPKRQQAHLRLASHFGQQPSSRRRTDELPWQLVEARAWQRLHDLMIDRVFFKDAWRSNQSEVRAYWSKVEANSPLRMVEAFKPQIDNPTLEADKSYLKELGRLLDSNGHPREALRLVSARIEHFRKIDDLNEVQESLGSHASLLKELGELDGAILISKEAARICRQLNDLEALALHLDCQAYILQDRHDVAGALALFKQTEQICRTSANKPRLALNLISQAHIYGAAQDAYHAMTLLKEAEQICEQSKDWIPLISTLGAQALLLKEYEDFDLAITKLKSASGICRQLGDLDVLHMTLTNHANVLRARDDLDGAMVQLKEAEQICRRLGNLLMLQGALGGQAAILKERGNLDGALTLRREQEHICRMLGNPDQLHEALVSLASNLRMRRNFADAEKLLEEAEEICRRLGIMSPLQETLQEHALMLRESGDMAAAIPILQEAEQICKQFGIVGSLQPILGNQAAILKAKGELDRSLALLKEEEDICLKLSNFNALSSNLGNQAVILQERGDLAGAMALHKKREQICRRSGNVECLSISLCNQAMILQALGDSNGAMGLLKEVELTGRNLDNKRELARALTLQSAVLLSSGRTQEAISAAEEAHQLATSNGYAELAAQILPILHVLRDVTANVGRENFTTKLTASTPPKKPWWKFW